jgi:hypothetical protein
MKEMAKRVPDAGSYAPVTVLVDGRADGVHISYDRMASLLAPYGNRDALRVARDLDANVEQVLRQTSCDPRLTQPTIPGQSPCSSGRRANGLVQTRQDPGIPAWRPYSKPWTPVVVAKDEIGPPNDSQSSRVIRKDDEDE